MKTLLIAVQFLTIIPARIRAIGAKDTSAAVKWFPSVGLMIGLALAAILWLNRSINMPDIASSALTVIILAVITGGIHLDGLGDMFDALGSRKGQVEMLGIMRDPHIGSIGAIAIASCLILKTAFLSSIPPDLQIKSIILLCVCSRWSMVFSMHTFPYARKDGKAKAFMDGINSADFTTATLTAIIYSAISNQIPGFVIMAVIGGFTYAAGRYLTAKFGGVTGDTIGAVSELSEVICLFILCL